MFWCYSICRIGAMTIDRIASRLVGHNALNRKFSGSARRSIMELRAHQFESGDESGNGLLSRQELVDCLKGLEGIEEVMHKGHPVSEEDLHELALKLDQLSGRETGQVNLFSFLEAFVVERPPGQEFDAAEEFMCEHILSFLCTATGMLFVVAATRRFVGAVGRWHEFVLPLTGQVGDYQLRLPFAAEEALGEEDGTFSYFELEFHSYRKRRMVRLTLRAWLFSLPAKCQKCVSGHRISPLSTLDRVRDFLDRAGFEGPEELPRPPPPPKPVWHEYEEDDYDYDYYQTWDEDEEDERYFTEREGRFELFSHSSDDEDNQSQVSYLPPPPMPGDFALPPPPPAVPKGPEFVMAVHRLKHVKAADGSSVTDSPEELAAWKAMRKANFPSKGNLQRKAEMEEKRRLSGALPDPPKVSMLEKLLRRTHGVERSGKGFGYKGCGKKGKFKGKGKEWKGKDGKGKEWKGKDGKGKGKFSGKKGKGKNRWTLDHDGDQERHHNHPTYAVPLPSVVANCVPLEAPFGIQHHVNVAPTQQFKWGLCRFFERGFCFHGENCQYEHSGASAQQVISSTAWWALPSSLANRAGRPGEGPAGGVFGSLRSRQLRPTRVEPYVVRDPRERRDGLLRRLLQPDVERYYSAILQCVRYIVSTDFLRLERPHIEGQPEVQPQPPVLNSNIAILHSNHSCCKSFTSAFSGIEVIEASAPHLSIPAVGPCVLLGVHFLQKDIVKQELRSKGNVPMVPIRT
ncbi:unnamed protein product [Durusdinium trenchii]|uniref:C3H1-type domain-containing protein n=1 Tax=Durusdinium trenchii TaxID=1381693 RepID=A0ABP0K676_9DINO